MKTNEILQGDALEILKTFPDKSIDCIITSPPYWSLRDYGSEKQLGLEKKFSEYVRKLCDIFDEAKRVLKDKGTCWINIADTYSGNKKGKTDEKVSKYLKENSRGIEKKANIKEKCLCQIPFRFSIEMANRGWILRNTIIWHKPNAMPSSVKDRFTADFEYLFFFVKNKKYYFNQQLEPYSEPLNRWGGEMVKRLNGSNEYGIKQRIRNYRPEKKGKNKRCVWSINTKPFPEAHFAAYPQKLIETPILAGCPKNGIILDPFFGAGTTGISAIELGRKYIGIELNPEYIEIAKRRIAKNKSRRINPAASLRRPNSAVKNKLYTELLQ